MKKISLLIAIILMTPLLAGCSLFGKKMTFEDAYNALFVPQNMAEVIEKIDEKAPFLQKSKFTLDASYNDMVFLATRLDTVGNYDVTNNIADVDLAFTANFNLDKSFMQSFGGGVSNSLLNTRPQESDTEIDNKQQLTDSMFNNRSQGMQQGGIELEQIEQDETINSQNNIPQESFSHKTAPTAEPTSDSEKKTFEFPMTKGVGSEMGSKKSYL